MRAGSMFIITVPSGFELEAKEEVEKLISGAKVSTLFFKGNLLVECPQETRDVVAALREAQTRYVGRVFPVQERVRISPSKESTRTSFEQVLSLEKLKSGETFLVQCKRRGRHDFSSRDIEKELGSLLAEATGAAVNLKNPEKIVIVQIFQNLAFTGVTEVHNMLAKPLPTFRKYGKGERPFTRAEHKIREAIEAFGLKIKADFEVLDLGAAPGGWTKVLSSLAKKVVAVDPADLDPSVTALPNVVHLRCKAEEVSDDIGRFHLLTNDMNLSPSGSARIMVRLADRLRKDGKAIMTVKFVTRNRKKHVGEAIEILGTEFGNFQVKRLRHNRYETTIFMEKI